MTSTTAFERLRGGFRSLAALLISGGAFGAGLVVYTEYQLIATSSQAVLLDPGFLGLFVWSVVTGVRMWRGDSRAMTWAKILFAIQIPMFTVHGFNFEYFTGASAPLLFGPGGTNLTLSFSAKYFFFHDSLVDRLVVGVNLVAVLALILLLAWARPNNALEQTRGHQLR